MRSESHFWKDLCEGSQSLGKRSRPQREKAEWKTENLPSDYLFYRSPDSASSEASSDDKVSQFIVGDHVAVPWKQGETSLVSGGDWKEKERKKMGGGRGTPWTLPCHT